MNSPHAMSSALPAAAPLAQRLRTGLRRVALAVWRALEAHGRRRAWRELRDRAERYEGIDTELARQLRDACGFLEGRTP